MIPPLTPITQLPEYRYYCWSDYYSALQLQVDDEVFNNQSSICTLINRCMKKSGKSDFAVAANVAYGEVKLEALGDVSGEYEDPDKLARSG